LGGNTINIVICDDNFDDRQILKTYVDKFINEINASAEIIVYESGDFLLNDFNKRRLKNVKILFLDIYMPGKNGIETAKQIRKSDDDLIIILTTSSREHGLDGYSVDAMQYLVKPLSYDDVKAVLTKCMKMFADSMRYIEVMANRVMLRVLLKDIIYIEIQNHNCLIHTVSEIINNYYTLDKLESLLDGSIFLRTHRSYIVNMHYIEDISENDFILKNGVKIPIRRNDKVAVKQAFRDYLFLISRGG